MIDPKKFFKDLFNAARGHRDDFQLVGSMDLTLIRADGSVMTRSKKNLIVSVGWDFISDAIGAASGRPGVMSHIAVGEDNTPTDPGQTALQDELARKAATYSHVAGTKTFKFQTTFDPGEATGAIVEAGVFNAAADGIMLDRVVFGVVNKGVDDTITQQFTFTMS